MSNIEQTSIINQMKRNLQDKIKSELKTKVLKY